MFSARKIFFTLLILSATISSSAQVITTVVGNGTRKPGFGGDGGDPLLADMNICGGLVFDVSGNMIISDQLNNRLRKVDQSTNKINTIAGTGVAGFSGDGGLAINAQLNKPTDLCEDGYGNIYFIDSLNNRVRKINGATGIITTVAGNGNTGYAGNIIAATAAGIGAPTGLALYSHFLYLSLGASNRVCRVDLNTGLLYSIFGTGVAGFSGDGQLAITATCNKPMGLDFGFSGELYIADCFNHRIRQIDTLGIVTTVAGNGTAGYKRDGIFARNTPLQYPTNVFVSVPFNLFIADKGNHKVRRVDLVTNVIYAVAGNGEAGYAGDNAYAYATCVKLNQPTAIATDFSGNLCIADAANSCVRKVNLKQSNDLLSIDLSSNGGNDNALFCTGIGIKLEYIARFNGAFGFMGGGFNVKGGFGNYSLDLVYQINGSIVNRVPPILNNGDLIIIAVYLKDNLFNSLCKDEAVYYSNGIVVQMQDVSPKITIAANPDNACSGSPMNFTATIEGGGATPMYQWLVNNSPAGTNSPNFNPSYLKNNDKVRCILISSEKCAIRGDTIPSNTINAVITPIANPTVAITASATKLCKDQSVIFTTTTTNAESPIGFQWQRNGINITGANGAIYQTNNLQNADKITCIIKANSSQTCVTQLTDTSNEITVTVAPEPAPTISIAAAANPICSGDLLNITATVQNAGQLANLQWSVNGFVTNITGTKFSSTSVTNGSNIICTLNAPNAACAIPPLQSNSLLITVNPSVAITLNASDNSTQRGKQIQLTATTTVPVANFAWQPANLLQNPSTLSPQTKPLLNTTKFTLTASTDKGCSDQASVNIVLPMFVPNIFSPNGDGVNDTWEIIDLAGKSTAAITVYNRGGQVVFNKIGYTTPWNGTFNGKVLPIGTYYYIINPNDGGLVVSGSVTIVR